MKIAPCMNCKDRKLNCHSNCRKYQAYKKKASKKSREQLEDYEYKNFRFGRRE